MKTRGAATYNLGGLAFLALTLGACAEAADDPCGQPGNGDCAEAAAGIPPEALPPAGYVVKYSTCTDFIESDARLRNNSRVVQVRDDGTIPLMRVEPVDEPADNFRRVFVNKLPKPLLGGEGVLRRARDNLPNDASTVDKEGGGVLASALERPSTPVPFVKLGQGVTSLEADGSLVEWVVSSEQLGEPVMNEATGKLEYQDTCFRNPRTAGHDTVGFLAPDAELASTCMVEELGKGFNAYTQYGYLPLVNYTTLTIPTLNNPLTHPLPDHLASYLGFDGTSYLYTGWGAALNDINGAERDPLTNYYGYDIYCHLIVSNGLEVPAAKRPATTTRPFPGSVVRNSYNLWRPVNPYLLIANDQPATAPDPIEPEPPVLDVPIDAADAMAPL